MSGLRVVLAGGGTGGHLYPGIAVAHRLQARCPGTEVTFVGLRHGLEERLVPREGFPLHTVPVRALTGEAKMAQVRALGTLAVGTWQAMWVLRRLRPHLVIGAGGYVMGPAVLAATCLRLPRVIMEQNLLPGLTVRVLARYAQIVFTAFPQTCTYLPKRRVECTGTPIRQEICEAGTRGAPVADGVLHLLVFGGSQGAHRINQALVGLYPVSRSIARVYASYTRQARPISPPCRRRTRKRGYMPRCTPSYMTWQRATAGHIWWYAALERARWRK